MLMYQHFLYMLSLYSGDSPMSREGKGFDSLPLSTSTHSTKRGALSDSPMIVIDVGCSPLNQFDELFLYLNGNSLGY